MSKDSRLRVVIAHEEETIREAAMDVARGCGYEVVGVTEGDSALALLQSKPLPAALVVDVALPRLLGYELTEYITSTNLSTRVILVASVYSKTAYKRRPSSLHGADDYVEQHHIVDMLGDKLEKLLVGMKKEGHENEMESRTATLSKKEELKQASEKLMGAGSETSVAEQAVNRAKRLARLIVADIALYGGDEMISWLQGWNEESEMPPPPESINQDLEEGRRLLSLRIPSAILNQQDFVADALLDLANRVRRREDGTKNLTLLEALT